MITWFEKRDKWVEGCWNTVTFFIHLDRNNKVTGLYLIEGNFKEKWVPEDEIETSIDFMKMKAEEILKENQKWI